MSQNNRQFHGLALAALLFASAAANAAETNDYVHLTAFTRFSSATADVTAGSPDRRRLTDLPMQRLRREQTCLHRWQLRIQLGVGFRPDQVCETSVGRNTADF